MNNDDGDDDTFCTNSISYDNLKGSDSVDDDDDDDDSNDSEIYTKINTIQRRNIG